VIHFSMKDQRNFNSPYSRYFIDNINFKNNNFLSPIKFIYNWQTTGNLKRLLKNEKIDIAHLHNIAHHLTPAIIKVLKKNNIPVVMTLHDYKLFCPNYRLFTNGKYCEKCLNGKYYNCTLNRCLKNSSIKSLLASVEAYLNNSVFKYYNMVDQFIAPSKFIAEMATRSGLDNNKIKVLYNFTEIKDQTSLDVSKDYLLYFGRLSEEKGLDMLTSAMDRIDYNLKIAGTGPDFEKLKNLIKSKNLENKIDLIGPKSGQELTDLITNAKAVIIPSIWAENMPMSMLESMAMGKIVLASDLGGMKEIINDGENGFLFSSGNIDDLVAKINRLLSINDLKYIEENAKKTVRFMADKDKYYENLIGIYNKLIN
jgi:glycosyltransferase involved in cell wall biosynthesis